MRLTFTSAAAALLSAWTPVEAAPDSQPLIIGDGLGSAVSEPAAEPAADADAAAAVAAEADEQAPPAEGEQTAPPATEEAAPPAETVSEAEPAAGHGQPPDSEETAPTTTDAGEANPDSGEAPAAASDTAPDGPVSEAKDAVDKDDDAMDLEDDSEDTSAKPWQEPEPADPGHNPDSGRARSRWEPLEGDQRRGGDGPRRRGSFDRHEFEGPPHRPPVDRRRSAEFDGPPPPQPLMEAFDGPPLRMRRPSMELDGPPRLPGPEFEREFDGPPFEGPPGRGFPPHEGRGGPRRGRGRRPPLLGPGESSSEMRGLCSL